MTPQTRDALVVLSAAVRSADLSTLVELFAMIAGLDAQARARLITLGTEPAVSADRLLSAREAARVTGWSTDQPHTGVSPRYLYDHSSSLPFVKRVGRGLRFSEAGLRKWMQAR